MTRAGSFRWASGDAYESYVGRWSRPVAVEFLRWLSLEPGARILDVGCGTGALTATVLELADPAEIVGVDPSGAYLEHARAQVSDPRARFEVAGADALPFADEAFDAAVSGLVLNFVADPAQGVAESARVVGPGGTVAAYVWDYAGRMELMRHFWDAAVELDPAAGAIDEGRLFPICDPAALADLYRSAGLGDVESRVLDVPTVFRDFDDYWSPFLSSDAPAPGYAMSLDEERRMALRARIRERLPVGDDGSISLVARACTVRGTVGGA
jgi:SAM-dependent methyltransferase